MSSTEETYLQELINDFPCKTKVTAEKAIIMLQKRYKLLEPDFTSDVVNILRNREDLCNIILYEVSKIIHKHLFRNILSNAGEFRKSTDPGNGFIGFGGVSKRIAGNLEFHGIAPNEIAAELSGAFSYLNGKTEDPVRNGVLFYRRYVRIHPYYDGNGRIGRLILIIYLRMFNFQINMERIPKDKLLKKINNCHKRESKPDEFERYLNFLLELMREAISRIEEDAVDN
ncbi:MAG: Fic family protein [Ignavibacteria bacterium]